MTVDLEGFDVSDSDTLHGFHIHASGDLGDGCKNAGGHFNPHGKNHSSRTNTDRYDNTVAPPGGQLFDNCTVGSVVVEGGGSCRILHTWGRECNGSFVPCVVE